MKRGALVAMGGTLLSLWCLTAWRPVEAAGDTLGRELSPAPDLETGLESLIGGLLGHHEPPAGRIEKVVVSQDELSRLAVTVSCSAGLEGRNLRGELLDRDKRVQREFRSSPVRLEAGSRDVDILFEAANSGSGDAAESAYLRISVDGGGPSLKRLYRLGKQWQAGTDSGGPQQGMAFQRIRPRPEALAAALPASEPAPGVVTPTPAPPIGGVRDHRGETRDPRVEVRDHRGETRDPRVEVRDHRGERRDPPVEVRDHRTRTAAAPAYRPAPQAAPPLIAPTSFQRQAVLNRTATVVRTLPKTGNFMVLDPSRLVLSTEDQGRGARGPGNETYDLLSEMDYDDIGLDPGQVANLTVYRDQNPSSGYFYFLPRSYHLEWLPDQGRYNMATLYLAATAPGGAGEVSMAASLTAGLDSSEIRLANELVQAYCRAHGYPSCQLRPLPVDPSRIAVSLAGTLRLFNIPPEKVAPVGLSDVLGQLELAWVTDTITKENVQLVMEQGGINGNVTFSPAAGATSQPASLVDLQIKLADPGSFERPRWRRGEPWRNTTPYPLRLKYLHAVLVGSNNRPALYSWGLGGARVPPGGRVEWDAASIPGWIDARAKRMWISYGIAEDCDECTQQVLKSITGGVSSVAASQITFHTINPIADTGAYELAVRVRSKYFDPEARSTQEKALVLKADNQDFSLGPIYAEDQGAAESGRTLFEYLLTVGMPDGTEHKAQQWIPSRDLRVLIGRSQIERALGFVPGATPPAQPPGAQP